MLWQLLGSFSFWLFLGVPALLVLALTILLGRYWARGLEQDAAAGKPAPDPLSADAFRVAISAALSAGALAIPVTTSFFGYLYLKGGQTPGELGPLAAAILFLALATIVGLSNVFSLATLTQKDGSLPVTKDKNTYLPAVFVSQLALLAVALILLLIHAFAFLSTKQATGGAITSRSATVPVLRPALRLGLTRAEVESIWGKPSPGSPTGSAKVEYQTPSSVFHLEFQRDKLTSISERLKLNPGGTP